MDNFDAWLAAMPVEDVNRRIAQLERELEVLRVLKARHPEPSRLPDPSPSRDVSVSRRRALSPEREQIVALVRERPNGVSPNEVALALDKDPNPIQTTMSRMARAGQLQRVGQGLYRLPSDTTAASLLNSSAGGTGD